MKNKYYRYPWFIFVIGIFLDAAMLLFYILSFRNPELILDVIFIENTKKISVRGVIEVGGTVLVSIFILI